MYERFIARQPILDEKLKLAGYELLFRAQDDSRAGASRTATSQLILSSTMLFDWNALVDGASAHVNFGAEEIMNGAALLLLPKDQTVIEIPPTLNFNEELIVRLACTKRKKEPATPARMTRPAAAASESVSLGRETRFYVRAE